MLKNKFSTSSSLTREFSHYKKVSSAWIPSKVMFSYIANITCIDYLAHAMLSVNWLSASKLIPTKGRRYGLQKVLYLAYVSIAVKWLSGIQPKNLSNPKVTFEWPIHVVLNMQKMCRNVLYISKEPPPWKTGKINFNVHPSVCCPVNRWFLPTLTY